MENDGTGMNVGPIAVKKKERRGQWKGKLHSEPASFLPPLTLSLWRFIPLLPAPSRSGGGNRNVVKHGHLIPHSLNVTHPADI